MDAVTPQELAQRLRQPNPPHLLDVREPGEHAFCALPDSRLIPLGDLVSRVEELADWQNQEIVVCCHHGVRSARAIGVLQQLGFERLSNLSGGLDRWSAEVDPAFPRY